MQPITKTLFVLFFILCSTTIIFLLPSCDDNPTDPEPDPGRRDYVWTEDTLDTGEDFVTLTRIWGSSPTNVYALGFAPITTVELWHYDGNSWQAMPEATEMRDVKSIWGFADYDIWIGTGVSTMWHFNGNDWKLEHTFKLDNFDDIKFENIYGVSRENIYAVGYAVNYQTGKSIGIIAHYDGLSWSFVDIPEINANLGIIKYEKSKAIYYILGMDANTEYIYTFDGKNLKEIINSTDGYGIGTAGKYVLINLNGKVFRYNNDKLTLWKDFTNTNFIGSIFGRSLNDFFNVAWDGIGHYNGTDYQTIYKTNLDLSISFLFENDIFVISQVRDNMKSVIIHGKLID